MTRTIALVEDERAIAENYRDLLQKHGFQVKLFSDRHSAWQSFSQRLPDLAIIDVGLGNDIEGGFELCRQLRAVTSTMPVVFLTARDSDIDAVSGFRLGADDYLSKDIALPHLLARILALFRRLDCLAEPHTSEHSQHRGSLSLDGDRLIATWRGTVVSLTVTEYWIVRALASRPGQVKSRQQLMDAASVVLDDSTITSHIKRIRNKFRELDEGFASIETVYGMGYRWIQD